MTIGIGIPRVLEVIDGVLFAFSFCVFTVFARYIIVETKNIMNGARVRVTAAWGFMIYFAGSSMWHGMSWWLRPHQDLNNTTWVSIVFIISGLFAIIGSMINVKVFTPSSCGAHSWIFIFLLALLLSIVSVNM